jgi:hypothetical protein
LKEVGGSSPNIGRASGMDASIVFACKEGVSLSKVMFGEDTSEIKKLP